MLEPVHSSPPGPEPLVSERLPDETLVLLLDRPARRNAIDRAMAVALLAQFEAVQARAVVLASSDPICFCAGADLSIDDTQRAEVSDLLYEVYGRMLECPVPIVAALQGPAVGGGAQLALAADLRIAEPTASLRFAGPGHGLSVGAWGLPSLVGRGRAIDLCLSMRTVAAREALSMGLVDRVVTDARAGAREAAAAIALLDADATARIKRIVGESGSLRTLLEAERASNRATWTGSVGARQISSHG